MEERKTVATLNAEKDVKQSGFKLNKDYKLDKDKEILYSLYNVAYELDESLRPNLDRASRAIIKYTNGYNIDKAEDELMELHTGLKRAVKEVERCIATIFSC